MDGLNNYYYTEITSYKRNIRNNLIFFLRGEDERITTNISDLAALFIVDADNINKEFYNEQEYELVKSITSLFLSNQDGLKTLNKKEAKIFVDLALNKRLKKEDNLPLILKYADIYNKNCYNEILKIDENVLIKANEII